jgi:hypothetical protein
MDLLSAIATCSLHGDFSLVIAMAMTFSHGNPYMVQNAVEEVSYVQEQEDPLRLPMPAASKAPRSHAEAEAQLRNIAGSEGAPVVGLLPVPVSWAALFARKPMDLFNACTNVSIATAKLSEFEYECGGPKAGRNCVLRAYAQAVGMDDLELDVLAELTTQGMSKQGPAVIETEEMLSAPVKAAAGEDRDRQWGADRLFFVLTPSAATRGPAPAATSPQVKK